MGREVRMKRPKFTDQARYPNGYRRAVDTDIQATFARIWRQQRENDREREQKVAALAKRQARG